MRGGVVDSSVACGRGQSIAHHGEREGHRENPTADLPVTARPLRSGSDKKLCLEAVNTVANGVNSVIEHNKLSCESVSMFLRAS